MERVKVIVDPEGSPAENSLINQIGQYLADQKLRPQLGDYIVITRDGVVYFFEVVHRAFDIDDDARGYMLNLRRTKEEDNERN